MEAIGLSRAAFLGNSQACQVIAQLAIRHPARVSRAVLQGPTAPPRDRSWVRQFIRWRMNWRFNTPGLDPISFADYRRSGYLRVLRTFQHSLDDHIEDHLPRIAAPTLIVRGECDPICRGDWARELAKMAPNGSFVEIPGVAHTLVYTSPVELANVTRAFLGEESPCPDRFSAGASWWDEAPLGSRR
jgi:pimeloyl-ACP methyl ester carboxylesterase